MRLVEQKAEIINIDSPDKIQNIANIARVCYKSEEKADNESNLRLVKNLIENKHFAMLEHEDYIFKFDSKNAFLKFLEFCSTLEAYFIVKIYLFSSAVNDRYIVSGNIRAWRDYIRYSIMWLVEAGENKIYDNIFAYFINSRFFDDIFKKYNIEVHETKSMNIMIIKDTDLIDKKEYLAHYRISARIICDRGISHELVRHRAFSFAQESTRYINYNKKEIEFIDYSDYVKDDNMFFETVHGNNIYSERRYVRLIDNGNSPQMARAVLPHNFKTEIVMTGNIRAWLHFFNLRLFERTGKAHPMIKDLAEQIYNEFEEKTPISKKLIDSWSDELWENENE